MGLRRRAVTDKTDAGPTSLPTKGPFDDILSFINKGTVIPIISNSIRIEQIFRSDDSASGQNLEAGETNVRVWTTHELLTEEWAREIDYPMGDIHNLARVAQFLQVQEKDVALARTKYLKFLTTFLLDNELDEQYQEVVQELKTEDAPFSKIASELGYPRMSKEQDPLHILAKLPFKIYITTSYFNFMEQALRDVGKKPKTQVVFWSAGKFSGKSMDGSDQFEYEDNNDNGNRNEKDELPKDFPTKDVPIVYHVFGLEKYPETLVLSEDDYLGFLSTVVKDTNTQNPVIPLRLRAALAESRLLLLGYHVRDWDFRVLFRFILEYRSAESAPRGILLQFQPESKLNENKSIDYLKNYFDKKQFDINWSETDDFIQRLWNEWDRSRKG